MIRGLYRSGLNGSWALILIMCGCAASNLEDGSQLNYLQQVKMRFAYASADQLVSEGQAIKAADELWELASEFPQPDREKIQIYAATILSDNRYTLQSYRYLKKIDEQPLSKKLLLKKRMLTALFYKQSRQANKIIRGLPQSLIASGSPDEQKQALALLSAAQFESDRLPEAILSMLALNELLSGAEKEENIERLWNELLGGDPNKLQLHAEREQSEEVVAWLKLALLASPKEIDRTKLLDEFRRWNQDYPQWVLPDSAERTLRRRWDYLDFKPKKVVMLLPLSGAYAKVGRAILAGFNEAHSRQSSLTRLNVATYNTDQQDDIYALYRRALNEQSADIIVGPVLKDRLESLVAGGRLEIPVIALNYLRDAASRVEGEFFQFGLLPEDEAKQMARRLWDNGHRFIVTLSSDNEWGERIHRAFVREYESLGGVVRETGRYNPEYSDHGNVIKSLFKLDESLEKIDELKWLLGRRVLYKPGPRDDISATALFARHKEAILIYPQLKYHYVDHLPVYSSSHAYSPASAKQNKRDLQGLVYCDIPFLVYQGPAWPEPEGVDAKYWRLYALGADAYTLTQTFRLMDISGLSVAGLTGALHMGDNRRLFRGLPWARLSASGTPLPLMAIN